LVAGAPETSFGGSGTTFVYTRPATGWRTTATFNANLAPSDGMTFNGFGYSVALFGSAVAIGAPFTEINGISEVGAVYIFGN
jgi:hypothetical protein